ncbi:MAG: glycerate kinase [wastewater metagenome]|nr:glycerate kinase [Candidatus Loosdrechtia aerotolerans]
MKTLNSLRKDALDIFHAGLHAVDPDTCMKKHISLPEKNLLQTGERCYDLSQFKNIYIIGFGKASGFMALTIEKLFPERIRTGIVNVRYGYKAPCKIINIYEAGHPVPDHAGRKGTDEIVRLLQHTEEDDLVFCLISGGGSALFELPCDGITLKEIQDITEMFLKCGARIDEMNTVRKHISQVKGGQLAKICKGKIISFILSDVTNDAPGTIASGPTSPDDSTFLDCKKILQKYELFQKIPSSIREHIQKGLDGKVQETPKATDPVFRKVHNVIIGNNRTALYASYKKAGELGYNPFILSSCITGEAKEVAKVFGAIAKEICSSGNPAKRPACIIAGGETTVTVKGNGLGGRSQEFTLSAAMEIDGLENTVILCAGTDGTDGNTEAAGAIADSFTITSAKQGHMNPEAYLTDNNSYSFFRLTDNLIITGPTKTNVMDIILLLVD